MRKPLEVVDDDTITENSDENPAKKINLYKETDPRFMSILEIICLDSK